MHAPTTVHHKYKYQYLYTHMEGVQLVIQFFTKLQLATTRLRAAWALKFEMVEDTVW